MAREVDRMLGQLDRAYRGGAWHGPAVLEVVADLDAARAAARPIPGAHTIWELVLHMAYWKEVVRGRLAGERPQVDESLNFPTVKDTSPAAWQRALAQLDQAHDRLRDEVARLEDDQLEEPTLGGTAMRYVIVHGMAEHDIYHAGQIAILRKPAARAAKGGAPRKPAKPAKQKKSAPKKPAKRKSAKRKPSSAGRGRPQARARAKRRR